MIQGAVTGENSVSVTLFCMQAVQLNLCKNSSSFVALPGRVKALLLASYYRGVHDPLFWFPKTKFARCSAIIIEPGIQREKNYQLPPFCLVYKMVTT